MMQTKKYDSLSFKYTRGSEGSRLYTWSFLFWSKRQFFLLKMEDLINLGRWQLGFIRCAYLPLFYALTYNSSDSAFDRASHAQGISSSSRELKPSRKISSEVGLE